MHGGFALAGVAHPNFKHGRTMKNSYLTRPTGPALEGYRRITENAASACELTRDIALQEGRIEHAVGKLQGNLDTVCDDIQGIARRLERLEITGP
jgi:hypothetical protein